MFVRSFSYGEQAIKDKMKLRVRKRMEKNDLFCINAYTELCGQRIPDMKEKYI